MPEYMVTSGIGGLAWKSLSIGHGDLNNSVKGSAIKRISPIMKKIVLAFLSLMLTGYLSAQRTAYGIIAGGQMTSANYSVRGNTQETGYNYGPLAGIAFRIPFENKLTFSPAIYYNKKGYTVVLKDSAYPPGIDAVANNVSLHTIDIAPMFTIALSKKKGHAFIEFGPVIDAVISGREKVTLANGSVVDRPMTFSFGDYGRITASVIGRLGYETKSGFFMAANYGHGLGSMNNADGGPSIKHKVFGLMIGKFFYRDPNQLDVKVRR